MGDHKEERVELRAMKCARHYYEKSGWEVKDVAGLGGEYAGCDLFLKKGSEQRKVEVKGCTKLYGIPDFYVTEIDPESKRLVADELCVVYYLPGGERKLAIISREDILPENIVPKLAYRLRKFKNARVMTKFLREIEECQIRSCAAAFGIREADSAKRIVIFISNVGLLCFPGFRLA